VHWVKEFVMIETKARNKEFDQRARQQYGRTYSFLSRSYTARNVLQMLEQSNRHILVVISNEDRGSLWRSPMHAYSPPAVTRDDIKRFPGGVVQWAVRDTMQINRGPKTGIQDAALSLIHELYHAYQWIFQHKTSAYWINKHPAEGTRAHKRFLDEIEIPTMEVESMAAKELGQPFRDDYLHYKCTPKQPCAYRAHLAKMGRNIPPQWCCSDDRWDPSIGKSPHIRAGGDFIDGDYPDLFVGRLSGD
jgi:hypothetical protein